MTKTKPKSIMIESLDGRPKSKREKTHFVTFTSRKMVYKHLKLP